MRDRSAIDRHTAQQSTLKRAIGDEIRAIISRRGLSQYDLAKRVGVSPGHLSDIMTGRGHNFSGEVQGMVDAGQSAFGAQMIGLTGIAALEAEMRDRLAAKNTELANMQSAIEQSRSQAIDDCRAAIKQWADDNRMRDPNAIHNLFARLEAIKTGGE